jgi:hypothetical protein
MASDEEINRKLDAILSRLDAWQPNIDGIPILQRAIEVLQRDMRAVMQKLEEEKG